MGSFQMEVRSEEVRTLRNNVEVVFVYLKKKLGVLCKEADDASVEK